MIAGAKILTATTTPDSLANALGTFLRPLRRLKMPVDDLLQIMALTLKSLPRLKEEIVEIYREKISHKNAKGFLEPSKGDFFPAYADICKEHAGSGTVF